MYQLAGEYVCKVDAKGRLKLPADLIRQCGQGGTLSFTVNRGFEKCLMMYPKDVWDRKTEELRQKITIYNEKHRRFMKYFYRGAVKVTTDSVDRILLTKRLTEPLGIEKEVVLFAYEEQIEIWDKDTYYNSLEDETEDFSGLAQEIFGGKDIAES